MSSLDKALLILGCYSANRAVLGVTEAAAEVGLPKSSVSRLMKSMAEAGLLEPSQKRRGYSPGPLAFRLGNLYLKDDRVLDLIERASGRLVDEFGLTSYIGVLDGTEVVLIGVRQGSYPVRLVLPKGMRLPAHVTAVGLALLARLPDSEILRRFPDTVTYSETGQVNSAVEILALARKARADGYARIESITYRGFNAFAVAVANETDGHLFSVSLSCPEELYTPELQARMRMRMLAEAREIGVTVGDPYWLARPRDDASKPHSHSHEAPTRNPGADMANTTSA
ncbi:IclR family transcriptional regulator [Microbaculum marinum]|uniref:IclR family transcriptional regulator n=1 Tax=Microbaculum marinum TaxID=1764581 RepID=A0AAW9S1N5_9HYPH